MNQAFRLKKIDELRNYLIEETNRNELMSKKHKNFCRVLNYIITVLFEFPQLLDLFPFLLLLL